MADINIDPKRVAEIAIGINKDQKALLEAFGKLNKEIENVNDVWRDSAKDVMSVNMKSIKDTSDKFMRDLSEYSKYLTNIAGEYMTVESKINKNADNFK